jgi:hypothetical protein
MGVKGFHGHTYPEVLANVDDCIALYTTYLASATAERRHPFHYRCAAVNNIALALLVYQKLKAKGYYRVRVNVLKTSYMALADESDSRIVTLQQAQTMFEFPTPATAHLK